MDSGQDLYLALREQRQLLIDTVKLTEDRFSSSDAHDVFSSAEPGSTVRIVSNKGISEATRYSLEIIAQQYDVTLEF